MRGDVFFFQEMSEVPCFFALHMTYGEVQMSEGVKTGGRMFDSLPSCEIGCY